MTTDELIAQVASRPTTEKLVLLGVASLGPASAASLAAKLGLSYSGWFRAAVGRCIRAGLVCRDGDRRLSLVGHVSEPVSAPSAPPIEPVVSAPPSTSTPSPEASSVAPPTEWRPKAASKLRALLAEVSEEAAETWDRLGARLGPDAWATWSNAAFSQLSGSKGKTPLSPNGLRGCLSAFVGNNADLAYPLWKAYLKKAAEKEAAPELALGSKTPSRALIE